MIFKKFVKTIVFILTVVGFTACGGPNGGENSNNDNTSIIRNKLICTYIQDSDNSNYLKFYEDGTAEYYSNGTLTYPRDQLNYTGSPTEVGSTIELRNFVGITLSTFTVNESNGDIFATQSMAGGFGSLRFSITIENANTITVDSYIRFGTVRLSRTSATAGTTIRITAIPVDDNARLDTLTVRDRWGGSIEVTAADGSHVFTFTMPAYEVTVRVEFSFHYPYPAPYTVTLGAENSGYTVYKAVGDFNIWEQTRPDSRMAMSRTANELLPTEAEAAEHYFNEYENFVDDAVADIEDALVNYNQATQDYIQPWLDNIKAQNGKYDRQHIDRTLEVIYNGISFFLTDLIKNTPLVSDNLNGKKVNRYVLCYSIEAICNEQYDKGYGFNSNQMDARYTNKKNDAINRLDGRSGLSQEDLIDDINGYNCAQVINILNQKLSTALNYLNQTKGTNIDLGFMKQAINLASSTQPVTAIRDHLIGNIKNYALDNNMEDAITYVNTQSQNN